MTGAVARTPFILLPAIDIAGGSVRPDRGGGDQPQAPLDPVAAARRWVREGASWLHVVDLDAAYGRGSNADVVAAVVRAVDCPVEVSGGIRDAGALEAALAAGAARAVVAGAGAADAGWLAGVVERFGAQVAVALDVRGRRLAPRGGPPHGAVGPGATTTDRSAGEDIVAVLARLDAAGVPRYVVTDVDRDGSLAGPNLELLAALAAASDRPLIASGGVSGIADLTALAALPGVEGAVVGRALYADAMSLPEALAALAG